MLIDTHAHYDAEAFGADREKILKSLADQGIGLAVNMSATVSSITDTLGLIQSYPMLYGAIGVHPESLQDMEEGVIAQLLSYAGDRKVVAIGEIGLDYHQAEGIPRAVQKEWFVRQLEVARATGLPVAIHSRDAAADTLDILKACHAEEIGGVVHCYSYSVEQAREYTKMGFFLGIGGVVTFHNGKRLKEVVKAIDLSHLVLETDSPYMAPEPRRGSRNDSTNLHLIAAAVADLKGLPVEEVEAVTTRNAYRLYPKLGPAEA